MLHVLLLLLKILGILLLLLIGLFLLVLLTPIRYSFELEKEEQASPKFSVRITWLCWFLYFKTSYIEKVFDYRMRILGRQIAGNQPEFLEKRKKRQKRKEQKGKAREEHKKNKENRKKKTEEEQGKPEETVKNMPVAVTEKKLTVQGKPEEDILHEKKDAADISRQEEASGHTEERKATDMLSDKAPVKSVKEKGSKEDSEEKKQKKGLSFKRMKSGTRNITNRIKSIKETKANLDKLPWREWLEIGKGTLLRFLKHVLPRKLEGSVAFGFDDPANTGYVTGLAAVFYSKYGEHFSLYPDFERKMFSAQCKGRGRIRPGYMLILVVSILKEKSIRTMIKTIISG